MIAYTYQDLFPLINEVIHHKWNAGWNEKNDKLKEIKLDIRPWKKMIGVERMKQLSTGSEPVIPTLLTHGYLIEGLPVPRECELCHNHTINVFSWDFKCSCSNYTEPPARGCSIKCLIYMKLLSTTCVGDRCVISSRNP